MKGFGIYVKNDLLDPKHLAAFGTSPLWLYLWLLDKMTSINAGVGSVLGGKPVKYEEIRKDLGISKMTARRWLYMLRDYNYINTVQAPYGQVITINKASKIFGNRVSTKEQSQSVQNRTPGVTKLNTLGNKTEHSNKTIQLDNTKTIQISRAKALNIRQAKNFPQITKLINHFETTIGKMPRPTHQAYAAATLIQTHGFNRSIGAINAAATARGDRYGPSIATLEELVEKWVKLETYWKRQTIKGRTFNADEIHTGIAE